MELINHISNDIFALFGAGVAAISAIGLTCGLLNMNQKKK